MRIKNTFLLTNRSRLVPLVLGLIFVIFVLSACAAPAAEKQLPKEVSVSQAAELRDSGAFVLDVRTPQEWNEVHIPGTTLIPLDELPNRLTEVPRDQKVVVVCRSGNRSATARDILLKEGFPQVTSMAGGVRQWASQGLPTVTGP